MCPCHTGDRWTGPLVTLWGFSPLRLALPLLTPTAHATAPAGGLEGTISAWGSRAAVLRAGRGGRAPESAAALPARGGKRGLPGPAGAGEALAGQGSAGTAGSEWRVWARLPGLWAGERSPATTGQARRRASQGAAATWHRLWGPGRRTAVPQVQPTGRGSAPLPSTPGGLLTVLVFSPSAECGYKSRFCQNSRLYTPLRRSLENTDEQIRAGSHRGARGAWGAEAPGPWPPGWCEPFLGPAPRDSGVAAGFQQLFCKVFLALQLF